MHDPRFDNSLIVPMHLVSLISHKAVHGDPCCPHDSLFVLDDEGNVHYFKYLGKNLVLGEDDAHQ